jgi:hypothetical protein
MKCSIKTLQAIQKLQVADFAKQLEDEGEGLAAAKSNCRCAVACNQLGRPVWGSG